MARVENHSGTTPRLLFIDTARKPDVRDLASSLDVAAGLLIIDAAWQTRHAQIALLAKADRAAPLQNILDRIRRRSPHAAVTQTLNPTIAQWTDVMPRHASETHAAALSVQPLMGPMHHFSLGRALRPLVEEGLAVVATGALSRQADDSDGFIDWIHDRIEDGDVATLAQYRALGPHVYRHQPTGCDLLPLFVVLGATPVGTRWQRLRSGDSDIGLVCGA